MDLPGLEGVVVDADGLNCLAAMPELFRDFHAAAVLTPHPGEFARLFQLPPASDQKTSERLARAAEVARGPAILVLKGAQSIIAA